MQRWLDLKSGGLGPVVCLSHHPTAKTELRLGLTDFLFIPRGEELVLHRGAHLINPEATKEAESNDLLDNKDF